MDLLSSITLPYWLMIAGAVLVAMGFLGFFRGESQASNDREWHVSALPIAAGA